MLLIFGKRKTDRDRILNTKQDQVYITRLNSVPSSSSSSSSHVSFVSQFIFIVAAKSSCLLVQLMTIPRRGSWDAITNLTVN